VGKKLGAKNFFLKQTGAADGHCFPAAMLAHKLGTSGHVNHDEVLQLRTAVGLASSGALVWDQMLAVAKYLQAGVTECSRTRDPTMSLRVAVLPARFQSLLIQISPVRDSPPQFLIVDSEARIAIEACGVDETDEVAMLLKYDNHVEPIATDDLGTRCGMVTLKEAKRKISDWGITFQWFRREAGKSQEARANSRRDVLKDTESPAFMESCGGSSPNWAQALKKADDSKFRPLPDIVRAGPGLAVVEGHVPDDATILVIQWPWIDLILDGIKSLEVRGKVCMREPGERIYLACSGLGGYLLGTVTFVKCHGPLTKAEWAATRMQHCVDGDDRPYGDSTYAYEFTKPERFSNPLQYTAKRGWVHAACR